METVPKLSQKYQYCGKPQLEEFPQRMKPAALLGRNIASENEDRAKARLKVPMQEMKFVAKLSYKYQ
jgi:hypothetical protein